MIFTLGLHINVLDNLVIDRTTYIFDELVKRDSFIKIALIGLIVYFIKA